MKLLMAVSEYHRGGGFPRHGADLATALLRNGHEVTVLTRRVEATPADDGIEFRLYRAPGPRTLGPMASEPAVLTRRLRAAAPHFDAMFSVGVPVLAPVWLIGPGTHRGYVEQTLSLFGPRSIRRWLEPWRPFHRIVMGWERAMMRGGHARGVIVGAERFAREYTEGFGLDPATVAVIPHGVDTTQFAFDPRARERIRGQLGIADHEHVLLNVAGRSRQKGLDVLVRALHRLPLDRAWRAVFVGDGSTAPLLSNRTADLRAAGRVHLLGRVPSVIEHYAAADLLVFPTRYDPWGMAVTEALATGLPAITTPHAGSAMAVDPARNGHVVSDVEDDAELAGVITTMWDRRFDRVDVAASVASMTWDEHARALGSLIASSPTEERRG